MQTEAYPYYGTSLDNMDSLNYQTSHKTSKIMVSAAQVAGQMALRLVHDHMIKLDVGRYTSVITKVVGQIYQRVNQLTQVASLVLVSGIKSRMCLFSAANVGLFVLQSGQLKDVSPSWMNQARGNFIRAANDLNAAIRNTDINDLEACRILNDRVMRVRRLI